MLLFVRWWPKRKVWLQRGHWDLEDIEIAWVRPREAKCTSFTPFCFFLSVCVFVCMCLYMCVSVYVCVYVWFLILGWSLQGPETSGAWMKNYMSEDVSLVWLWVFFLPRFQSHKPDHSQAELFSQRCLQGSQSFKLASKIDFLPSPGGFLNSFYPYCLSNFEDFNYGHSLSCPILCRALFWWGVGACSEVGYRVEVGSWCKSCLVYHLSQCCTLGLQDRAWPGKRRPHLVLKRFVTPCCHLD